MCALHIKPNFHSFTSGTPSIRAEPSAGMFGTVRTKEYREYLFGIYLTEPYQGVRYGSQYPTKHSGKNRYKLVTRTRNFSIFGMPTQLYTRYRYTLDSKNGD